MGFIANSIARVKFVARDNAPVLYFAAGIVGLIGTGVTIWKARPKYEAVLEDLKKKKEMVAECQEKVESGEVKPEDYTEKDAKIDLWQARIRAGWEMAKIFGEPILLGIGTVGWFGASVGTALTWYKAAVLAYAGEVMHSRKLEQALIAKEGVAALDSLLGDKTGEAVIDVSEDGTVEVEEQTAIQKVYRPTMRFFGQDYTNAAEGTAEGNIAYLTYQQNTWNNTLNARMMQSPSGVGYVYYNEVLQSLGYGFCDAGWNIGWSRYKDEELNKKYGAAGYIDFGFMDRHTDAARRAMLGAEEVILLDFNTDATLLLGRLGLPKGYQVTEEPIYAMGGAV